MNVESASVERRTGRTILPQFHAAFSIGAVVGSLVGAACAAGDVPVLVQFLATAVVATLWRLVSIPMFIHDTLRRPRVEGRLGDATPDGIEAAAALHPRSRRVRLGAALGAWREPRTLLIGLVIMAAALSEGSANDWLSLAVVDGFDQTEAVGAIVFGAFVGAMTVMRLLGTRLIDRHGRVAVLRVSGVVSIAGLLLFGFAPNLTLAGSAWSPGVSAPRSPSPSASRLRPTSRSRPPAASRSCPPSPRWPRSRRRRCWASRPRRWARAMRSSSSSSPWSSACCSRRRSRRSSRASVRLRSPRPTAQRPFRPRRTSRGSRGRAP
ncbi:MFS transporter [Oerskovia sp. M15]